jgi:hypothetical protein
LGVRPRAAPTTSLANFDFSNIYADGQVSINYRGENCIRFKRGPPQETRNQPTSTECPTCLKAKAVVKPAIPAPTTMIFNPIVSHANGFDFSVKDTCFCDPNQVQ